MTEIKSLPEAFDYVNQRYVFNNENYPVIVKLTEQEKTFFALKHTLLHMQKNIQKVLFSESFNKSPMSYGQSKEYFVWIVINMLKASEIVDLQSEEIMKFKFSSSAAVEPILNQILPMMEEIAKYCEAFDHHTDSQNLTSGLMYTLRIKESLRKSWSGLLSISQAYKSRVELQMTTITMDSVFKYIPAVMMSKQIS